LEQKINDVDHIQRTNSLQIQKVIKRLNELEESHQTQEPPKQPHQEKPDNERELDELKNQKIKAKSLPTPAPKLQLPKKNPYQPDAPSQKTQIQIPSSVPLVSDVEQTSEVDLDQTDEPPQERKNILRFSRIMLILYLICLSYPMQLKKHRRRVCLSGHPLRK
jgi:hypothetical protein